LRLLGFTARVGLADTVGAAWAAARFAKTRSGVVAIPSGQERRALAVMPVAALRVDPAIVEGLAEVAIERIGQVFDLPRSTLPARYGDELLHRIDQALGTLPEPIARLREHVAFTASRELPGGTTQVEAIDGVIKMLLAQLRRLLERYESGLRRLDVTFGRLDAATIPIYLIVSRPTRSDKHLWTLLRPKVERLDMGYGVERITLAASQVVRLPHRQESLPHEVRGGTSTDADDAAFAQTLDTLAARLGHDRVLRIELRESHRPERAACLVPNHQTRQKERGNADTRAGFTCADRPSRLLEAPEPVRVLAVTPDGPVIRLWRHGVERRVLGSIGPERLGGEWWCSREPSRDYFRLQEESGRWLWLFQERTSREWFLHGEWT